jgi:DNA-binding transcriptional regulator YhcF (GntR family)
MSSVKVTDLPKYERVKRQLIREIESGRRASGEHFPSERQLLEQFGVSRPTLVRSLQELVREGYLVRKQGKGTYVADRSAGNHSDNGAGHSAHRGELVVFLSRVVAGMTGAAREVQLRILRGIQDATGDACRLSGVRQVPTGEVDTDTRRWLELHEPGVALVIEPSFSPALMRLLQEREWSVWSVNEPCAGANSVRIDQEHAGYLATRFLLEQGRTRVALLNGPRAAYWGFDARYRGYIRAITEAGLPPDDGLVLEDDHAIDSEAGRAMMRSLLDRCVNVDAVVGASDSKAIGAMACAAERGIAMKSIAFVSIDNTLACEAPFPLPAVAMPFEEMGFQAAWQARAGSARRHTRDMRVQTDVILRPTMVER